MAMSSRRQRRPSIDIWPGFVDALTQLVMIIIFVLLVFTAGQFYLTSALSGRDAALAKLTAQINQLTEILALERKTGADLKVQLGTLSDLLASTKADLAKSNAAVAAANAQVATLTSQLAGANAQIATLNGQLTAANSQLAMTNSQLAAARANATDTAARLADAQKQAQQAQADLRSELSNEVARRQAAENDIAQRDDQLRSAQTTLDQLNAQIAALQKQLQEIAAALDLSEAKNKQSQVQIADLGRRLNEALASKVAELAGYRSEFFGRLRQLLGDRSDIRIVGDRFVFQSEVLFEKASADLSPDAKDQLTPVVNALKEIASKIPSDLNWVLQVEGHTDKVPINSTQFKSNWELSTARAVSVVKFLIEQGIPATHVSAAGFGEFQPVDPGDSADSYRRNRRIELKLTSR